MATNKLFIPPWIIVSRYPLLLLAGAAAISALLLGHSLSRGRKPAIARARSGLVFLPPKIDDPPSASPPISSPSGMHGSWQGIQEPPTQSAEQAELTNDAKVIGVCIGGRARAYALDALSGGPMRHVINDVLAGCPVSVSYCDQTHCARVFTAASTGAPLQLGVGGWQEGKGMILQIDGVNYGLEDGENLTDPDGPPLPYQHLKHERTTWGEWLRAHPNSDVYTNSENRS